MKTYLYLLLNIGSICIPLLYSFFEKKFHFIQYFKIVSLSIVLVAIPFLVWDGLFTFYGVWGFNTSYHVSFTILNMPVEEWLFFFCIPYACLFTSEVIQYLAPKLKISLGTVYIFSFVLVVLSLFLVIFNFGKLYTTINFSLFLLLIILALKIQPTALQSYYPIFLIILIPFFIVNGILTGSFIDEPVVWYNNSHNMGVRFFTIPFEDIFYAFNLLFSIQLIFNYLKIKKGKM